MKVQFDWQAANEDGTWETIASTDARPMLKVHWRIWAILIAALVAMAAGGRFLLQHRYQTALRRIAFQIQCAIDLEARALAERDTHLFLAQQDSASADWFVRQAVRFGFDSLQSHGTLDIPQDHASLDGAVKIQDIELKGDVAWVQVITGQEPRLQVRFYRRTDLGWKHTAPHVEFWQESVELAYGTVNVHCHERDLPHIEPLIKHVLVVLTDFCVTLDCPPDTGLKIEFAESPKGWMPSALGDTLILPSPWLSGIPLDGTWDAAYLDELADWVRYMTASDQDPNPLREPPWVEYPSELL